MPPKTKVDAKKAEADRLQGLVLALLREEENKYCSDCDGKQPRWASWNLGVFICIRCAGIHRNLGVHISKVKSVNLDSWTAEQCQSMRVMGNAKAKLAYEAELPDQFRRPQTDQALESFIRAKYEHKRYMQRGWEPPRIDISQIPAAGEESRSTVPAPASTNSSLRAPTGVRTAQLSPRSLQSPVRQGNELFDMSSAPVVVAAAPTPSLLDFDFSAPAPAAAPTATNGDMDDLFGSFVSAGPTANPSHSAPPPDPQPSAAASELSSITGDLSALSMGPSVMDDKKSHSDIMALFGSLPKTAAPPPQAQPQHNWGGGLFGGAAAAPAPTPLQQQQMNLAGLGFNFGASFGATPVQQSVQQQQQQPKMGGGMGDLSGLMMGGNNGFGVAAPAVSQMPQMPSMPQANAFDSLSLNSLFPGGLNQAAFPNPQTAAAFAAASPFASQPPPMQGMMGGGSAATLNFDSLL